MNGDQYFQGLTSGIQNSNSIYNHYFIIAPSFEKEKKELYNLNVIQWKMFWCQWN